MSDRPGFFELADVRAPDRPGGISYAEFVRIPALSAGVYRIPAGGTDPQRPHEEDEIYYVMSGRSSFTAGDETRAVGSGTAILVPARVEHRFHDVSEDLTVLVVFGPAESG